MRDLIELISLLRSSLPPPRTEKIALPEAMGRVLAEDIIAPEDVPSFDRAAMDGYAVRAEDITTASRKGPVLLRVIGVARTGEEFRGEVKGGEAVAISTGAPIPRGADTVVRVEDTRPVEREGQSPFVTPGKFVAILVPVPEGKNISPKGEDVRGGEVIAQKGERLTPPLIGLLAALGQTTVSVFVRPKVAILPTGTEVIPIGGKPKTGQVRDATAWALAAGVVETGALPFVFPPAPDDPEVLKSSLTKLAASYDLLLTTGGVSVGQTDLLRSVWKGLGGRILFSRLPLRPGKSALGVLWDGKLSLGLSGTPAAALTTFDLIVRPLLTALMGIPEPIWLSVPARLTGKARKVKGLYHCVRVRLKRADPSEKVPFLAVPLKEQKATVLRSLASADGYALIPPGREDGEIPAGTEVSVFICPHRALSALALLKGSQGPWVTV